MQAGQLLPHAECGAPPPAASAWLTGGGIALSLASALAAAAARRGQAAPRRFLAGLGLLIGLLFAFAMLLQLLATLLVDPCAR
ncbi:hypothetical protein BKE38_11715 [Pseudoroseomonas deserti]|uniref:Uncharacterized protein n=2 Tax=Teichococcus deserti TaxID=1817963 RepID=A0A1V2H327_9PROT|nr:hypothetical protein BKE38_11715 [Pseudoroseomonas deserti]